ncbi:MAG: hypothetical protein DRI88_04225 [Bacteroidetes bacterium]|nr:MAG: hypothetical protein DRI88_04225 [Bacteroidota bacterium]RLD73614.1 MAG: hypothetical protein DRI87_03480 [Bacteroidota bacterium]RLD89327.1 MAG: hypothetical protein DRJ02_01665 [Bacteroidota bacterium]
MKKYLTVLLLIVSIVTLIAFTSCTDFFDLSGDCDETKMPVITKEFSISLEVKYKDGLPFEDEIEFKIYKKRCQGTYYGTYIANIEPNNHGIFTPEPQMYSLENKKDVISFIFTIQYTPIWPNVEQKEEVIDVLDYDQVKNLSNDDDEVIKMYKLTLPINSDGT